MVGVSSLVHLLVSHWPVYCSRGHGSYRWSVCSLVTRPSVRVMSLVRLLDSWSLVCLFGSWPLACSSFCWSAVGVSLAMVVDLSLAHRSCVCSTRRWCVVGVSLVSRWYVVGVSLVCHWCVVGVSLTCRCPIAVHGHWSVAHPSAHLSGRASVRVRFVCRWSVTRL